MKKITLILCVLALCVSCDGAIDITGSKDLAQIDMTEPAFSELPEVDSGYTDIKPDFMTLAGSGYMQAIPVAMGEMIYDVIMDATTTQSRSASFGASANLVIEDEVFTLGDKGELVINGLNFAFNVTGDFGSDETSIDMVEWKIPAGCSFNLMLQADAELTNSKISELLFPGVLVKKAYLKADFELGITVEKGVVDIKEIISFIRESTSLDNLGTLTKTMVGKDTIVKLTLKLNTKMGATVQEDIVVYDPTTGVATGVVTKEGVRFKIALELFELKDVVFDAFKLIDSAMEFAETASSSDPAFFTDLESLITTTFPEAKIDDTAKYLKFSYDCGDETKKLDKTDKAFLEYFLATP